MSNTVYGIDLGTTYSAIARINELEVAEIIENQEGMQTTPSVVFFENEKSVVVGDEAKRGAAQDPDNTVALIKRHIGEEYTLQFHGHEYTPESISALILRELVNAANDATGEDVKQVVITVPAYFGTQEREATKQAGLIAGLDVVGIVAEPVAAALSVGMTTKDNETVFIYDLGGGTFDTTVMRLSAGKVEVIATDGNRVLGGADWDEALASIILEKAGESAEIDDDLKYDPEFQADLSALAEQMKRSLTKKDSVRGHLNTNGQRVSVEVTRDEFNAASEHLIHQTIEICERTLGTAQNKIPGLDIDKVILVGGSSRMPMVADTLRTKLGWDPVNSEFDLAVAKGAAIYGQAAVDEVLATTDDSSGKTAETAPRFFLGGATAMTISNVLSRSVGLEFYDPDTDSTYISFFAHANDTLPLTPDPIHGLTSHEGQTAVNISLYEQAGEVESPEVASNRGLSEVRLPLPGPMPKNTPVEAQCSIDAEGLIRVVAKDPATGNIAELEAKVSVLTEQEVRAAREFVSGITLRS